MFDRYKQLCCRFQSSSEQYVGALRSCGEIMVLDHFQCFLQLYYYSCTWFKSWSQPQVACRYQMILGDKLVCTAFLQPLNYLSLDRLAQFVQSNFNEILIKLNIPEFYNDLK